MPRTSSNVKWGASGGLIGVLGILYATVTYKTNGMFWVAWQDPYIWPMLLEMAVAAGLMGGTAAAARDQPAPWKPNGQAAPQTPIQPPAITPAPAIVERAAVVAAPVVSAPASTFVFGKRSLDNLATCHPDLVKVAHRALELSKYDFTVISALRTIDEQRVLFSTGKSKTMNSRHLGKDGKSFAIDFMAIGDNGGTWVIEPFYREIATAFKTAAKELGIQIVSGYDWTDHWDSGHVQLDALVYPDAPDLIIS